LRARPSPSVGAECLGRSLRVRASCPAGSASPDRIDAPRARMDTLIRESRNLSTWRGVCSD
jgi:hypothetical protein